MTILNNIIQQSKLDLNELKINKSVDALKNIAYQTINSLGKPINLFERLNNVFVNIVFINYYNY